MIYELSPDEKIRMAMLEAKHKVRKELGLPKYDEVTVTGYSAYLRRVGYSEKEIKQILEAAQKEE